MEARVSLSLWKLRSIHPKMVRDATKVRWWHGVSGPITHVALCSGWDASNASRRDERDGGGGGYLNDLFDNDKDEDDALPARPKTTAPPHRSHTPSTGQNSRPSMLSNSRNPTGTLLSNPYNSAAQKRVAHSSTPPVRAGPAYRPQQASPPRPSARPQRSASAASLPPSRQQLSPSSPPLKPRPQQSRQAGSPPPPGLLRRDGSRGLATGM